MCYYNCFVLGLRAASGALYQFHNKVWLHPEKPELRRIGKIGLTVVGKEAATVITSSPGLMASSPVPLR